MSKYQHIIAAVFDRPWAILPGKYNEICEAVDLRIEHGPALALPENERKAGMPVDIVDGIAIVHVVGVMSKRMNMFADISGGVSTEVLGAELERLVDDSLIDAIVLNIDSPGGAVDGGFDLADRVSQLHQDKPIVAYANGMAASAAYLLASAANRIVANETAQVGSIGVITTHIDETKANEMAGEKRTVLSAGYFKAIGSPDVPLDSEGRAYIQKMLDEIYNLFLVKVAFNRSMDLKKSDMWADGKIFLAKAAFDVGLIDQIGTLADAVIKARALADQRQQITKKEVFAMNFIESLKAVLAGKPETACEEHREIAEQAKALCLEHFKAAQPAKAAVGDVSVETRPSPEIDPQEVIEGERGRVVNILEACDKAGLNGGFALELIKDGTTSVDALQRVITKSAKEEQPIDAAKEFNGTPEDASSDKWATWDKRAREIQKEQSIEYADALKIASKEEKTQ